MLVPIKNTQTLHDQTCLEYECFSKFEGMMLLLVVEKQMFELNDQLVG